MNGPVSLSDVLVCLAEAPAWIILLLKATVLVAAAWLLHRLLAQKNPRWRVIVWRGLAVGLFLLPPFLWIAPVWNVHVEKPMEPRSEMARLQQLATALVGGKIRRVEPDPQDDATASTVSPRSVPFSASSVPLGMAAEDPSAENANPSAIAEIRQLLNWRIWFLPEVRWRWLLAVWLVGTSILTFRLVLGFRLLNRLLALSTTARRDVLEESSRVASALGIRRPFAVRELQFVTPPFLCRWRHPVLVLPARMCEDDYRRELPGILAHELSHMRSLDLLWNPALHLLSVLLWFHPLTWRMRQAHASACESVADAVSASFLGDRVAYSRTLARVALEMASPPPVGGMAMARVSDIRRRLEILNRAVFSAPLPLPRVLGFGLLGLLGLVFLGGMHFVFAEQPSLAAWNASQRVAPVEADGPVTEASPKIRSDADSVAAGLEFPQNHIITGRVRTADGTSLAEARVLISTPQNGAAVVNGYPKLSLDTPIIETDRDGRFAFDPQPSPYKIIVLHDDGFAEVPEATFRTSPEITLISWARVAGTLHIGSQPAIGEPITLLFDDRNAIFDAGSPQAAYEYATTTDHEGRFVFERVPPGTGRVARKIAFPHLSDAMPPATTHAVYAVFSAGETSVISIGGDGRPVVGRVVLPRGNRHEIDWNWGYGQLRPKSPAVFSPGPAESAVTADAIRTYAFALQSDGSFRADDIPAGTYELMIQVFQPPVENRGGQSRPLIGTVRREMTLAPGPEGRTEEPFDIGLLKLITIRSTAAWSETTRRRRADFETLTGDGQGARQKSGELGNMRGFPP